MKSNKFRTPLIQSGALLLVIILIISMIPSGEVAAGSSGVTTLLSKFLYTILFFIGLVLSLAVSIAVLIGIFLAAIALQSTDRAAEMYATLKVRLASLADEFTSGSCEQATCGMSKEECEAMQGEFAALKTANSALTDEVASLKSSKEEIQSDLEEISSVVAGLKENEAVLVAQLEECSAKVAEGPDASIQDKMNSLEKGYGQLTASLEELSQKLEQPGTDEPAAELLTDGIFQYIPEINQQQTFIAKVAEAVAQDMTYAQIDDFLTKTLPKEVDEELKAHPSLTKDYIREVRK